MIVNKVIKLKFSSFYTTKNGMINSTCILINKLKNKNISTNEIQCNNAGENKSLEKVINGKDWKMAI